MLFLRPLHNWWFGLYYTKSKMVDYQINLEAWLQEASLFKKEPVDNAINFEELFSTEKANQEGNQDFLGLDDLGWLDEKVDLAIFDNPDSLLDHHYEMDSLMDDDPAFILGLVDGNATPAGLPSDPLKISDIDLDQCINSPSISGPASPDVLDTHLASPGCTALQVHSPLISHQLDSPASPAYSDISDSVSDASSTDPGSQSTRGKSSLFSPEVVVSVCDSPSTSSSSDEAMTIEDVSSCVRKRKFVSDGESIPKVKILLRESEVEPSRKSKNSRPKDRKERKKVQNKEAAARYRIKKRMEEKERSDEIAGLEDAQKKLKEKHDSLQSEIKYLKSLMCEILQKKGIMK